MGTATNPATSAIAITPNDSADLANTTKAVYIGGDGDLKVDMHLSGTVTFSGVVAGTLLPIRVDRVYSTGTTATNLLALN